jgi:hypothetical protein
MKSFLQFAHLFSYSSASGFNFDIWLIIVKEGESSRGDEVWLLIDFHLLQCTFTVQIN